jgi:integral membrane protein
LPSQGHFSHLQTDYISDKMIQLLKTNLGRLRILGFLEGFSLLALIFVAMPLKYFFDSPGLTKAIGPVHGALFIMFLINTVSVAVAKNWNFWITLKVVISCFLPFGTFYIDHKILSKIQE